MESLRNKIRRNIKNGIKIIDYLIWLLADPSKFTKRNKKTIKKIVIIHLGAIGELLMVTPLLGPLKKYLNCEIYFMTSKGRENILEGNPHISKIITYSSFKENINYLKQKKIDLAIIIWPGSLKITSMCLLAGIKYRIGCFAGVKNSPQFLFTKRTFPIKKKHIVQKYLDILRLLNIDDKNPKIEFYFSKKEKETAKKLIKKFNLKDYIIVHPGFSFSQNHKYPSRLWSFKKYAEVIDYLTSKYKIKVLLTGNKEERIFSERIFKNVKNKKDVIITNGILDYRQFAVLVKSASLVIGPGTSIIHLATAFDTPIVELVGKENLYEWHPWTEDKNYRAILHQESCTGCDNNYCSKKTIECMNSISSKEVIDASKYFLNKELKIKNEN